MSPKSIKMKHSIITLLFLGLNVVCQSANPASAQSPPALRVLNFQADNGFQHPSKSVALTMVEDLGKANDWDVVTTVKASSLTSLDLTRFDVIVFNNNCGNRGPIMTPPQQLALKTYVQKGGGFVGIHCAGAIWKEGGEFQPWYEGLIGTKLIDHPKVQKAKLNIEDHAHPATRHLPEQWIVTDEWHRFGSNPRKNVRVLISVDEDSYKGKQKMGGDHPFTWCHQYDGGRSFFTSLGHTEAIYANPNFQKLVQGGIVWAASDDADKEEDTEVDSDSDPVLADPALSNTALSDSAPTDLQTRSNLPVTAGLILDLDADKGVQLEGSGKKVESWRNQVPGTQADLFVKRDEGRKVPGSGMPGLKTEVTAIGGHNALVFLQQELVNMNEDAFDDLLTGKGYTWFAVISAYKQRKGKPNVNSFFGNLKNGPNYEGFWGNLMDDNRVWMGSRNGIKAGKGKPTLWNEKLNPQVVSENALETHRFYLVMGRMGDGQGTVDLDLYVNSSKPVATKKVPVNPNANASKMAVGQERDATNHPGKESYCGEMARLLIFERPLSDDEIATMADQIIKTYTLDISVSPANPVGAR